MFNFNNEDTSIEYKKEQKRQQKCKEIKSYIEYLHLCKKSNSWARIYYPPDWVAKEQRIMSTVHIGDYKIEYIDCIEQGFYRYAYYVKNQYDSYISMYQGWFGWWETTPIEDIVKEKGDYKEW